MNILIFLRKKKERISLLNQRNVTRFNVENKGLQVMHIVNMKNDEQNIILEILYKKKHECENFVVYSVKWMVGYSC
jgi:hypothetical protein